MQLHRLINSKYPTIAIFDDIADEGDFEAIYAMQAKTNPRLRFLDGLEGSITISEIPASNQQVHSAIAPFIHTPVTPSRFSSGKYGVLYGASTVACGLSEVRHHIQKHLNKVEGIAFDNIQLREYVFVYNAPLEDVRPKEEFHLPDDYTHPQAFGARMWEQVRNMVNEGVTENDKLGVQYNSVRSQGDYCVGLFSPKYIEQMKQKRHYSMMYDPNTQSLSDAIQIKRVA